MSEVFINKIRNKMPWVLNSIRIPYIDFPDFKGRNLDIPTPSRNVLLGLIYIFLFWLMMGGVYLMIPDSSGNTPLALGANPQGEPIWIYPRITDAFVIESIVAGAVIFIGAIGFIILYQSTKHIYNTRYARLLIAVGFILATVTFIILQYIIIQAKSGG
ncbi:MAG: hypothetical protein EU530_05200 [Promethearchaeota archaeon]|nr:MAG: hypothetical protein EU530_05200 [Candidatus Lokiarchaeota archaeon]